MKENQQFIPAFQNLTEGQKAVYRAKAAELKKRRKVKRESYRIVSLMPPIEPELLEEGLKWLDTL